MKDERKAKLEKELKEWLEYEPVNGMGKWARQVRIDSILKKLKKFEKKDDTPKPGWDDDKVHTEGDF